MAMATSTAEAVASWPSFTSIALSSPSPYVVRIELCHGRHNSMTRAFWDELTTACTLITQSLSLIRVVLVTGRGDIFSAGLDLVEHASLFGPQPSSLPSSSLSTSPSSSPPPDISRATLSTLSTIERYQRAFTSLEQLPQPVLALVHGACIGGGIDLAVACDVRLATTAASFCVKEVDVGMAADVGTLQRLGKVVGNGSEVRRWCYTGCRVTADEAAEVGLVSRPLLKGKEEGWSALLSMAQLIAAKSPVAILGTKRALLHARDHSVREGLEMLALWNAVHLHSDDVQRSMQAVMTKTKPLYANL